ncbi:MAG: MFS transporter [Elusimicrobiales bacterium]
MQSRLNKNAWLLLSAVAISSVGDWLNILALITVFSKAYGAASVAFLMAMRAVPGVLLGPWVANHIDRFQKTRVLIFLSVAQAALALTLGVLSDRWALLGAAAALSTLNLFSAPLIKALLPTVCNSASLSRVNSYFASIQSSSYVLIPLLSGVLISIFGPAACFNIDAATFVVFGVMIAAVHVSDAGRVGVQGGAVESGSLFRDLLNTPDLKRTLFAFAVAGFSLGTIYSVEISFFAKYLNVDPRGYGSFVAIAGAGVLMGSLLCGRFTASATLERVFVAGLALFGTMTVLFSFNRSLVVAIGLIMLSGFGEGLFSVSGTILVQLQSRADRLAGNFTLLGVLSKSFSLFAMLVAAMFMDYMQPAGLLLVAGLVALGVAAVWGVTKAQVSNVAAPKCAE